MLKFSFYKFNFAICEDNKNNAHILCMLESFFINDLCYNLDNETFFLLKLKI